MTPAQKTEVARIVYELARKGIYTKPPHMGKQGDALLRTGARRVCWVTPTGKCFIRKTASQLQRSILQNLGAQNEPSDGSEPLRYLFHVKHFLWNIYP